VAVKNAWEEGRAMILGKYQTDKRLDSLCHCFDLRCGLKTTSSDHKYSRRNSAARDYLFVLAVVNSGNSEKLQAISGDARRQGSKNWTAKVVGWMELAGLRK
jgi:hypothetical protein